MTDLEVWCLATIMFVFQALIAYVIILVRWVMVVRSDLLSSTSFFPKRQYLF